MHHRLGAFVLLGLLAACRATSTAPTPDQPGFAPVTLTAVQLQTVQAGVKTMLDEPPSAELSAIKAASSAKDGNIHVCGYVNTKASDEALPFYVELSAGSGTPKAERGQVGTTASKRSKIDFVCRGKGLG
ncbi:MAG: hypothetical protein ACR2PO_18335 [Methyloligellaceae bacterium]